MNERDMAAEVLDGLREVREELNVSRVPLDRPASL